MLQIRLLGGALIEGRDGPLEGRVMQRRQLSLLAVLSICGERPVTRDKLLALLWPESETGSARHNLADTVYVVRKELGEGIIRSLGDDLLLDRTHLEIDVVEFETAVASGELVRATEIYGGPLLDGFHLPHSRPFEEWLETERRKLADAQLQALEELARGCERRGTWSEAVGWWRQAAAVRPYDSRIALGLMNAFAAAGNRLGAIRWADTHQSLMEGQYGLEVSPEIKQRAHDLRNRPDFEADITPLEGRSSSTSSRVSDPADVRRSEPDPNGMNSRRDSNKAGKSPDSRIIPLHSRAGIVAFTALLILAIAIGLDWGIQAPEAPADMDGRSLDPSLVLLLPFRTSGAAQELEYLGEGMVDLLAGDLTGEGGLRAVDPSTWSPGEEPPWNQQVVGQTAEAALHLARRAGAAWFISGSLVGTPERLTVRASLVDARTGEAGPSATVAGAEDSLREVVHGLTAQLLGLKAGEAHQSVAQLTDRSLPAVRAFLEGRAAHRRGDYEVALREYGRALDLDSTFALAGIEVLEIAGWVGGSRPVRSRAEAVVETNLHRLPERDRVGFLGRIAPREPGRVSSALESLEATEAALRRWPNHPVLWYRRGDRLLHRGRTLGLPNWAERARRSFERAIELDPNYAEPVHHLAVALRALGDTAALRQLVADQVDRLDTGPTAEYLRWEARHALGSRAAWPVPPLDSMGTDATLRWIGVVAQDYGFAIPDGRRATALRVARAGVRDQRRERVLGAFAYALNGGRPSEAAEILESIGGSQRFPYLGARLSLLTAMYADGDAATAERAARKLARAEASGHRGDMNACVLHQWNIHAQTHGIRSVTPGGTMSRPRLARNSGAWQAPRDICWAVVDANRAAAEGSAAGDRTRDRLDHLLSIGRSRGLVDDGHTEYAHLALARLQEAAGDTAAALRALRRRGYYLGWQPYLASILREQGRLASSLGASDEGIRAFEHYLAFRTDPEPTLRPQVDSVRAKLASLRVVHRACRSIQVSSCPGRRPTPASVISGASTSGAW